MFHKVSAVAVLPDHRLNVQFVEGATKVYDVTPLFAKWKVFEKLKDSPLFYDVHVDQGGYGIVWDDETDLSGDELWANGITKETPFDGLMSFGEATRRWGLNESTLRKAISYGKLVEGTDVRKFGKQWVIATTSMLREYGDPDEGVLRLEDET